MNPAHKTKSLQNTTVHYWEYHADKEPTLLLIHGFRGTHHGLAKLAEHLTDFHLIIPDLPGFGDSEPFSDAPHSLEHYSVFLDAFIHSLQLPAQPIIVGHSFGSIIASHYLAQHPETATKLILINPISSPALKGPRAVMTRLALSYYWLGRKLPARAAKQWLSSPPIVKIMSITMTKTNDDTVARYIHEQHKQHFSSFAHPSVVAEAFHASVNNDVSHVSHALQLPTLLIVGEKDDITSLEKQRLLHDSLPASTLYVISDVGHLINYEKPKEAAEAIQAFLSR